MRVRISSEGSLPEHRVSVSVYSDEDRTLGVFRAEAIDYGRILVAIRSALTMRLQRKMLEALRHRLAFEASKNPDETECQNHGIERSRCGCIAGPSDPVTVTVDHRVVQDIAQEIAAKLADDLMNALDFEEE